MTTLTAAMRPVTDQAIAALFVVTFPAARVRLEGGRSEPYYQPPAARAEGVLSYAHDYAASALHETAHWCLAGAQRRRAADFGYAYLAAAQRGDAEQRAFEAFEVRTQAIEWRFSLAAGLPFHVSVDCVGRDPGPFRAIVAAEAQRRCYAGWPPRAERFALALASAFGGIARPSVADFAACSQPENVS